jgi:lipid-A-disaccharide synthase-like uncharacterized protein
MLSYREGLSMANGIFQDKEGNLSSKRIVGFAGSLIFFGLLIYSVIAGKPDMDSLLWTCSVFAGSLLGIGVMERKK